MKRFIAFLIVIIIAVAAYYFGFKKNNTANNQSAQPLTLKKHSLQFNTSIVNMMNAYFDIANALVDADTTNAKLTCKNFIDKIDKINLEELKQDTASIFETAKSSFEDVKANAQSFLSQTDITEMRKDFGMISEMLYPCFKAINYEGPKMYWQNCTAAFGEGKEASWVSKNIEIQNPFLGKVNLHFGEIKDTIKTK